MTAAGKRLSETEVNQIALGATAIGIVAEAFADEAKQIATKEEKQKVVDPKKFDRTPGIDELRENLIPTLQRYERHLPDKNATRILAIDPGRSNIAIVFLDLETDSLLTTKVEVPGLKTTGANVLYRELAIENWIRTYKPQVIFKEGIAHGSEFGVAESGMVSYIVERLGICFDIPVVTVNNGTLRSYMKVPKGDDTKSVMRLQVYERYGLRFGTNDETDAYAVARTGIAMIKGEIDIRGAKVKAK